MKQHIRQAWTIIKIAWTRNLNYRFTVVMYRIGEVAEVLALILMWSAVYANTPEGLVRGFTLPEMITYVLLGNLFAMAVRNFIPGFISRDIMAGRLSMFLVKPMSYIKFIFFNEFGRMLLAVLISVATQVLLIIFFSGKVIFNTEIEYILVIIAMLFLAFVIELQIGFLVGTIAFWTDETEGIQATIDRVKRFFSGGYFPLSLLPSSLATASVYMPFTYSFFTPAYLYLKKMSIEQGVQGLIIQIAWILALSLIIALVWKKGLKKYEATGS